MGTIDELRMAYRRASMVERIIVVNVAVFVLLRIAGIIATLGGGSPDVALRWVEMPTEMSEFIRRPWTILTYMVSHYGFMHILFNMLWFYWLGRIFLECFTGKQLTGLYIIGGLTGAVLFALCYNLLPTFSNRAGYLIGASAAVIAVVVAAAVYLPNYKIGLLFIGQVSLKWVAIVTVLLDLLSIDTGNVGGHIAHLGGALAGLAFAMGIKRGTDITAWLNVIIDHLVVAGESIGETFKRLFAKPRPRVDQTTHAGTTTRTSSSTSSTPTGNPLRDNEAEIDRILAKLKQSGYTALTDEEKATLFDASRKR